MNPPVFRELCAALVACSLCQASAWDDVSNALITQFDKSDVVALGEWHGNKDDAEVRNRLIRHPMFATKARYVVIECGNSLHQRTIDRFAAGGEVKPDELRKVWQDVTSPGACDSPVYRDFLNEVRSVNQRLPTAQRVRVLAADPPIDWGKIQTREDWLKFSRRRDAFAADLIAREVLQKNQKALVITGSGHLWQKNQIVKEPNLAAILKRDHPGKLYTVTRIDAVSSGLTRLDALVEANDRPVLLHLADTRVGALPANEYIGRDLPVRFFDANVTLREVIDACIYTGQARDMSTAHAVPSDDATYEAEKQRRLRLIQTRR